MLDEALTLVDATAERLWEAEMYRLKGKLLQRSEGDGRQPKSTPEACFQKALTVARTQQAKSLELRAATSLVRLWQSQNKRQDAYDLLAPVYGWFTEGV
jgi:predicted ATPase